MIKLKNILTKILEVICVIMFAFITIVGTYQIVTRYAVSYTHLTLPTIRLV